MTSYLRTFADETADMQRPFDVAVVIPTVLRPSLVAALESIFAQDFPGRIHVLVGVDHPTGDLALVEDACRNRPPNCAVQILYPGYSTSVRHGGLCPARDGGVLRCILTYLANSTLVAYLDDDNWWGVDHLRLLRAATDGRDWGYSLRWFVHPDTLRPICVDQWESVGPGGGIFNERWGGFVDPNCLMIDKTRCPEVPRLWNFPVPGDAKGMSADRRVFAALSRHEAVGVSGKATVFYRVDPSDGLQPVRLRHMGPQYDAAAAILQGVRVL
jgi:hypothetical protein